MDGTEKQLFSSSVAPVLGSYDSVNYDVDSDIVNILDDNPTTYWQGTVPDSSGGLFDSSNIPYATYIVNYNYSNDNVLSYTTDNIENSIDGEITVYTSDGTVVDSSGIKWDDYPLENTTEEDSNGNPIQLSRKQEFLKTPMYTNESQFIILRIPIQNFSPNLENMISKISIVQYNLDKYVSMVKVEYRESDINDPQFANGFPYSVVFGRNNETSDTNNYDYVLLTEPQLDTGFRWKMYIADVSGYVKNPDDYTNIEGQGVEITSDPNDAALFHIDTLYPTSSFNLSLEYVYQYTLQYIYFCGIKDASNTNGTGIAIWTTDVSGSRLSWESNTKNLSVILYNTYLYRNLIQEGQISYLYFTTVIDGDPAEVFLYRKMNLEFFEPEPEPEPEPMPPPEPSASAELWKIQLFDSSGFLGYAKAVDTNTTNPSLEYTTDTNDDEHLEFYVDDASGDVGEFSIWDGNYYLIIGGGQIDTSPQWTSWSGINDTNNKYKYKLDLDNTIYVSDGRRIMAQAPTISQDINFL